MLYTFAKMRRTSLFSDDTCKVLKLCRAMGGNSGQTKHETSFPSPRPLGKLVVISVSRTSMKRFWVKCFGTFGWVEPASGCL